MDVEINGIAMETLEDRALVQAAVESRVPLPEGAEARQVLLCCPALTLTEAVCGQGEVTAEGELSLCFLLEDGAGEPLGFTARSTFRHTAEVLGAGPGCTARVQGQILECRCSPQGEGLNLSLVVELDILVCSNAPRQLVTNLSGPGVETKFSALPLRRRMVLGETNLRIRDELPAQNAARVVLCRGAARVHGVQFAGATANVEGELFVTAVTADENGNLQTVTGQIPFQDAFTAAPGEQPLCRAFVRSITATAADEAFGVLDIEAVIGMELSGIESSQHRILLDAYDREAAFHLECCTLEKLDCRGLGELPVRISEQVAVPRHLPEVKKALHLSVLPCVTGVSEREGRQVLETMLLVTGLYRCEGGFLHSFTEDVPVFLPLELPEGDLVLPRVTVLSAALSGVGRLLEMNISFLVQGESYGTRGFTGVSEVVSGGEAPKERGILIYCTDRGETLWDVGKRFCLPPEEILRWNDGLPEDLPEGSPLLLLR